MDNPEKMRDFFAARVEQYDAHMQNSVGGCKEVYREIAQYIPEEWHRIGTRFNL